MKYAPTDEWRLIIALWRFAGLRRTSETMRLRWENIIWEKNLMRVYASKTKKERIVPLFPEIMGPLVKVFEQRNLEAEWIINDACPEKLKNRPDRKGGTKDANLSSVFDDICRKAELPILPMIGNNMRASCIKDVYSGKYPELHGDINKIAQMFGHSPVVALEYYKRYSMSDYGNLTASFPSRYCPENDKLIPISNSVEADMENGCVKNGVKHEEKEEHPETNVIDLKNEIPCFQASYALENKGQQSKYTPQDSNL